VKSATGSRILHPARRYLMAESAEPIVWIVFVRDLAKRLMTAVLALVVLVATARLSPHGRHQSHATARPCRWPA